MLISQIVLIAARILNLKNVVKYLENKTTSGNALEEVDALTKLTNLVICELSAMEIYIIRTQAKTPTDGKIAYSVLRTRPIKIIEVFDNDGNSYPFTTYPEYFITDDRVTNITYAYLCSEGLDEKVVFSDYRITPDKIAFGVVAEYLLTLNDFEGAIYWHDRFVNTLCALKEEKKTELKNVTMKGRDFV
jgi:hypothetical protein